MRIRIFATPMWDDGTIGGEEVEREFDRSDHAAMGQTIAELATRWIGKDADGHPALADLGPGVLTGKCDGIDMTVTVDE